MSRYSIERREWVLRQMMPPRNRTVSELAEETGITTVTLYAWRKQARAAGAIVPGDGKSPDGWSSQEKFRVVLESAALNEAELGEYCRRKGVYVEQIREWRAACEQANASAQERSRSVREQLRSQLINATHALNLAAGVSKPKVFLDFQGVIAYPVEPLPPLHNNPATLAAISNLLRITRNPVIKLQKSMGPGGEKLRIYSSDLTTRRQPMPCKALRLMPCRRGRRLVLIYSWPNYSRFSVSMTS